MTKKIPKNKMVAKVIDYKATFGTDAGQRVLYDLCKACGLLTSSFSENRS